MAAQTRNERAAGLGRSIVQGIMATDGADRHIYAKRLNVATLRFPEAFTR
jgi:hypothetical protein